MSAPPRALLDVNVLIALHDPQHVHHEHAVDWLDAHRAGGWASCPITQNGCLRILSQPGYVHPRPWIEAAAALDGFVGSAGHAFWPDDVSLLDRAAVRREHVHGHRQLTDLYLLALAVHHQGCFVTFDARVPLSAVHGATARHLVRLLQAP